MNKVTGPNWKDSAQYYLNFAKEKACDFYKKAEQPGTTQQKVLAAARATIGIAAIYQTPTSAIFGVGIAAATKEAAEIGTKCLDGLITELWNQMNFNQKMVVSTVGSLLVFSNIGVYLIEPCATVFAAKIGAELVLNNLQNEELAATVNEIKAKNENEKYVKWQTKIKELLGIKSLTLKIDRP